jgi:DNA-binding XRE family transcriptional regulator
VKVGRALRACEERIGRPPSAPLVDREAAAWCRQSPARVLAGGLGQEAAGDGAGMTQSQYGRIERGEVDPSIKTLARLAVALGVAASDLLRGV